MDTIDMLDICDAIVTNFQSEFPLQFQKSWIHITWSNCFSQVDMKVHYSQQIRTRERWTDLKREFIQPDHPGVNTRGCGFLRVIIDKSYWFPQQSVLKEPKKKS